MATRPKNIWLGLAGICLVMLSIFPRTSLGADTSSVIVPSGTPSKDELQNLIQAKSQDLDKINQQLQTTKLNLEATKSQRLTLQQELTRLNTNINQLSLNIKGDQITAQKLALEIDSLNYDIRDTELSIGNKQGSIGDVLRRMQQNDHTNLLLVFLKNKTLADSMLESNSLLNLKDQLFLDIASLKDLQQTMNDKLGQVNSKKGQIELHQQNLAARKVIVQDQQDERKVILAQTKDKESLYQQQLAELEKQQNAVEDQISGVEDQLRAQFNISLLPSRRHGLLAWPVTLTADGGLGHITQCFGKSSYLYRGRPHNGMDIGVNIGTPIFAAADGVVIGMDNNDVNSWRRYQYGKYVLLKHDNNFATLYAHLSRQVVRKGEMVRQGQLIGYSGKTGYSTGPHLHLGLYWAPSIIMRSIPPAAGLVPVGVVVDPKDYLTDSAGLTC